MSARDRQKTGTAPDFAGLRVSPLWSSHSCTLKTRRSKTHRSKVSSCTSDLVLDIETYSCVLSEHIDGRVLRRTEWVPIVAQCTWWIAEPCGTPDVRSRSSIRLKIDENCVKIVACEAVSIRTYVSVYVMFNLYVPGTCQSLFHIL